MRGLSFLGGRFGEGEGRERTCLQKGSNFQSLSGTGVYSIVQILGWGSNNPVWIPLLVWKGVVTLHWPKIGVL